MNDPSILCRGILFIGAPGSGKGTQCGALGNLPGFWTFGAGAVLRQLDPDSALGQSVRPYISRGDFVPSDLMFQVFRDHLVAARKRSEVDTGTDWVLLDAYPRDADQLADLRPHVSIGLVVHLRTDDEAVLKERLRRRAARPDDRDDAVIEHRFDVYHERTDPLLAELSDHTMVDIDAIATPLEILEQIIQAIRRHLAV
jgi:adenylate kinase